jgi:hypothetical protein
MELQQELLMELQQELLLELQQVLLLELQQVLLLELQRVQAHLLPLLLAILSLIPSPTGLSLDSLTPQLFSASRHLKLYLNPSLFLSLFL